MENKYKRQWKSYSLDTQEIARNTRKSSLAENRNLRSDQKCSSPFKNTRDNKFEEDRNLKLMLKRGVEENMLSTILHSLKNNNLEQSNVNQDMLKKAREFYKKLNVFDFKDEDFYFLFTEELYKEKKDRFHSGQEPVEYFKTVLNEDYQPFARCRLNLKANNNKKKYDFKYIRGGDKQALVNNSHDDKMFSDLLEQDALTQLNHVSQHHRRPSYQLQKQFILRRNRKNQDLMNFTTQEKEELESQEDRWNRIKQKIKENKIVDIIRNAKEMANQSSVYLTYTEAAELDKQEEAVYQYLKRRGRILDKRVLDSTKIKILKDDSQASLINFQSPDKNTKPNNQQRNSLTSIKKNENNASILLQKSLKSQGSSSKVDDRKSVSLSVQNNSPNNLQVFPKKNSVFKEESFDLKSKLSQSIDNSPLTKRLSQGSVISIASSKNSSYKYSKQNNRESSFEKQKSIFKISQSKHIKLDKNNLQLIQHFKDISNKCNEQYFFLVVLNRKQLEEYLNLRYPEQLTQRILNFMECPQEMNFRQFRKWIERFNSWTINDILFFCFYIFDFNQDGLICQTDVFDILRNKQTQMLEQDFKQITRFVAIKIKYTKNLENLIEEPLFPELYQQKNLTYMTYRKIAEYEDFGEKEKFLKKIKEHKEKGVNLTLFSIWDQYKDRFLDQKEIEEEIQIQESLEENEKKKLKGIISLGKGEYTKYFKSDKKFKLNFNQFKSIFIREKPFFFYDMLACLSFYKQDDIEYPYDIYTEFTSQICKLIQIRTTKEQQEKQQAIDNQMTAEKMNKIQVQKILSFYKHCGGAKGAKNALQKLEIVPNIQF
ncbi:hypothetical protein ABPG72_004887 [Tetrahymena utriculariae]